MGIVVNTNTQSLFAQRALRQNTGMVQKSIEKLSTGYRINRAGDDAAGLSISNKMTTLIRGMDQAKRNIGDGIGMISTIDGALGTVQDNLQ
ncbi:MAG: flagellin, partial [Candidatus Melainabacteria bacterium]|nr:flagellin [Candidatus Melainabacteria bacterium]